MKVAVFAGGVDTSATETKGTVLIHTAEEVNFNDFIFISFKVNFPILKW